MRAFRKTNWIRAVILPVAILAVSAMFLSYAAARAEDDDEGEVWLTSQGTHRLFVLQGQSSLEAVPLPAGAGPHLIRFSPSGEIAYVSGMGNGTLFILRADDRQLVQTLNLGPAGTHEAKPSPSGSTLLVAQIPSRSLIKIAADEEAASWTVSGSLTFPAALGSPICTIFRDDGQRAYVSLLPTGLAIVDVPTMTLVGTHATDGFIACGMIKSRNGKTVTIASSGSGGHIYRLNTATDTLVDAGTLGAADWHSFNLSANQRIGLGSSPNSDELIVAGLTRDIVEPMGSLLLDPTPGVGNDQPDAIAVRGNTVFVSLRASGKLAIIKLNQRRVRYLDVSPPAPFNPMNCAGCAVHGVTVRPIH